MVPDMKLTYQKRHLLAIYIITNSLRKFFVSAASTSVFSNSAEEIRPPSQESRGNPDCSEEDCGGSLPALYFLLDSFLKRLEIHSSTIK
jgi:hypothetical protein